MSAYQFLVGGNPEAIAGEVLAGYDLADVQRLISQAAPMVADVLKQTQTPVMKQPAITPATPTSPSVPLPAHGKPAGLSTPAIVGIAAGALGLVALAVWGLRGHRH